MAKSRKPKRKKSVTPAQGKDMFLTHYRAGRFEQALVVARKLIAGGMKHPNLFSDAATACIFLYRWQDAIKYATQAIALDPRHLNAHDVLAHAYGALKEWEKVKKAGNKALSLRMEMMAETAPLHTPRAPALEGANKNVIAFSLFGGNSKYCETAVLNCLDQPKLYPEWICRFYVDGSVPDVIIKRLTDAGGEVIHIADDMAHWPGPMWRFAAYDSPDVKYVILRDADSVISTREVGAVEEWLNSSKNFHAMRDNGSHTELLLAGLWGVAKGALPPMAPMIETFLQSPPSNAHFADQFFLRQFVWLNSP